MKKNNKLMMALAIVATFIVGFLAGLFIEYPKVNQDEISGTIGKVNNYRNTKATEADIELQNDLKNDKDMQQSITNYMTFYYSQSMEFGKTVAYVLEQAKEVAKFSTTHKSQIITLENYGKFLDETRKELLLSTLVCKTIDASSPQMIRNAISRANNIISQMNHRNGTLLSFIDELDAFILQNGRMTYPGLDRAHDLLVYNQIGSSLATKNKVLIKYFDKKKLYADNLDITPTDVKAMVIRDLEALNAIIPADMEQLGLVYDQEKLGLKDNEKLGWWDNERLGSFSNDVEVLSGIIFLDAEKLGGVEIADSEKLGTRLMDSEKLSDVYTDTEILKGGFWDNEKLGLVLLWDNENLGGITSL